MKINSHLPLTCPSPLLRPHIKDKDFLSIAPSSASGADNMPKLDVSGCVYNFLL